MCTLHHGRHATQSVYNGYMTDNVCVDSALDLYGVWQQRSNCGLEIMYVNCIRAFEIQYVTVRSTAT